MSFLRVAIQRRVFTAPSVLVLVNSGWFLGLIARYMASPKVQGYTQGYTFPAFVMSPIRKSANLKLSSVKGVMKYHCTGDVAAKVLYFLGGGEGISVGRL